MRRTASTRPWPTLLCALAVLAGAGSVQAQSGQQAGAGSYAAPLLKIPVGARLMSSPDAVAGMQPDASLMYSNPAFLSGIHHTQAFITTSQWLEDLSFTSAGVAFPVGKGGTVLGIGTTVLYSAGLTGYDDAMGAITEQTYYNAGLDFTLSHAFQGTGLSLAMGATYLREHVFPQDGSGYAFHIGGSYWMGRTLLHAAARDLGGSVSYDAGSWPIASEWMAGGGRVFNSGLGQFYAGAQVAGSDSYGTRVQAGVDYRVNGMFSVRTGVVDNLNNAQAESPFLAGFGVHYAAFAVEYAYTPQEYFSGSHTFTLSYNFGSGAPAPHAPVTVPVGDLAPENPRTTPTGVEGRAPAGQRPATSTRFVLIGGLHSWLDSARSEARALELVKIPSKVEMVAGHYRVVIGRFDTFAEADTARRTYKDAGHVFDIIAE